MKASGLSSPSATASEVRGRLPKPCKSASLIHCLPVMWNTPSPARYVVDLGLEGLLKAGAVAHPSRLQVPDDLEKLKALERKVPMLFLTCERDAQFPLTSSEKADEILGSLTAQGLYRRVHYDDNDHGFAVRVSGEVCRLRFLSLNSALTWKTSLTDDVNSRVHRETCPSQSSKLRRRMLSSRPSSGSKSMRENEGGGGRTKRGAYLSLSLWGKLDERRQKRHLQSLRNQMPVA